MKDDTQDKSTSALATHCYAILMTAMPAVVGLARDHGVLLTQDALNFIEDTAATCLIQSAIAVARARSYQEQGIDFATVDAIECGKRFVELSQCPEFRETMEAMRVKALGGEVGSEGEEVEGESESVETIGPSDDETIGGGDDAPSAADGLPVSLSDGLRDPEMTGDSEDERESESQDECEEGGAR